MVDFTGLLENARHPVGGPWWGTLWLDFCKNRLPAGIRGWAGTATGGHIHVVHISHTHPPKEIIQALRKYLLGKISFGRSPIIFLAEEAESKKPEEYIFWASVVCGKENEIPISAAQNCVCSGYKKSDPGRAEFFA